MQIQDIESEVLKLVDHAKKLKQGMDIFRNIEFPVTTLLLSPKSSDKILDVGCGQSILPSFIANHYQSSLTVTDMLDVGKNQNNFFKAGKGFKLISDNKFKFKIENATKLSFPDESFDSVYAVSSIEHIPDDGDSKALKEMMRVTKKGGTVVVTVPFSYEYLELKMAEYYGGFERRYDLDNLKKRLLNGIESSEIQLLFLNNKFGWLDEFCNIWYQEKLFEVVSEFSWRFTKTFFTISSESNPLSRGAMIKIVKN